MHRYSPASLSWMFLIIRSNCCLTDVSTEYRILYPSTTVSREYTLFCTLFGLWVHATGWSSIDNLRCLSDDERQTWISFHDRSHYDRSHYNYNSKSTTTSNGYSNIYIILKLICNALVCETFVHTLQLTLNPNPVLYRNRIGPNLNPIPNPIVVTTWYQRLQFILARLFSVLVMWNLAPDDTVKAASISSSSNFNYRAYK